MISHFKIDTLHSLNFETQFIYPVKMAGILLPKKSYLDVWNYGNDLL